MKYRFGRVGMALGLVLLSLLSTVSVASAGAAEGVTVINYHAHEVFNRGRKNLRFPLI